MFKRYKLPKEMEIEGKRKLNWDYEAYPYK